MQFLMSPGGRISKSRRRRPELPPSSETVTTAVISSTGPAGARDSCVPRACAFSPERSVERPVPPPIDTIRSGAFSALLCKGVTRVRLDIAFIASRSGAHGLRFGVWRFRVSHAEMPPEIAPLSGASWASLLPLLRKPEPLPDLQIRRLARNPCIVRNRCRLAGIEIRFARADIPA
jgi:hypothetical protein